MALKGEAKRVYQRDYMRRKRLGLTKTEKGLTNSAVTLSQGSVGINLLLQAGDEAKIESNCIKGTDMVGGNGLEPMTSCV